MGAAVGFIFNQIEILHKFLAAVIGQRSPAKDAGHQSNIIQYPRQWVVDLMHHAGSQLSQRHHFILMQNPSLIFDFALECTNFSKISEKAYQSRIDFLIQQPSG